MKPITARTGALAVATALIAGGCGGGPSGGKSATRNRCRAVVGFEAPLSSALGRQQLAFARLAVADDNLGRHTTISLDPVDTRSSLSLATSTSDQFAAQPRIVAVIGPASNAEVQAVGPIFARAGLGFISGSATGSNLTGGANPTFFRVVPSDSLQGPEEARFVLTRLRPRSVLVLDGQDPYSRQLLSLMMPVLRLAKLLVTREPAGEGTAPLGALAARVPRATSLAFLAWHAPREAEQLGRLLLQARKTVTLVGPDRLYAPGVFTVPGSYVTAFAPDITAIPADATIARQAGLAAGGAETPGAPVYAATHVIDDAIAAVCQKGETPSRTGVLAAVRTIDEPSSVLGGLPIRFRADGELANARWFLYRINSEGSYKLITNP